MERLALDLRPRYHTWQLCCSYSCYSRLVASAGIRDDNIRGDYVTPLLVSASSSDPMYNARTVQFTAVNRDVYWPVMLSVRPRVSPFLGRSVTVVGSALPPLRFLNCDMYLIVALC